MSAQKKVTAYARATTARQMVLGVPRGISVEGAKVMHTVSETLCNLRIMTKKQILRMLPQRSEHTLRRWLEYYPYIRMKKIQASYYDGERNEWIKAIKVGVYMLTPEAVAVFNVVYREMGRPDIAEPPTDKSSWESCIQASEIFSRLVIEDKRYGWMSNAELQEQWRLDGLLDDRETLSTTGNLLKYIGEQEAELWGVSVQTKNKGNMLAMAQRVLPVSKYSSKALVFAKHESLARPLSTICQRKSRANVDHVRFLPYEFTWHHPRWFKAVLDEEPWDVLDALLEYYRAQGYEVVDRKARYGVGYGRDNPYRYQVTMNSAEGKKWVEYVDTTYGVPVAAVRGFVESRKLQVAPKPTEYPERYVLYVASEGERKGLTEAAEYINSTVQIRLIDWPEGSGS